MDFERRGPWYGNSRRASGCPQAIATLIDPDRSFSSEKIQRLYAFRSGYTINNLLPGTGNNDQRFVAAVAKKIAERGTPQPCSIEMERWLLQQCHDAGILSFVETTRAGSIHFMINEHLPELESWILSLLYPELLLSEDEVNKLIEQYKGLCTKPEQRFLDMLALRCKGTGMGLLLIPQRPLSSIHGLQDKLEQRADFAIEIPFSKEDRWLRLVIEIDDASHEGYQLLRDKERDESLKRVGWEIIRLSTTNDENWGSQIDSLIKRIVSAIGKETLNAAGSFRDLHDEKREAVRALIEIPLMEAQLIDVVSELLYRGNGPDIKVDIPGVSNVEQMLESTNAFFEKLYDLHGLTSAVTVRHDENNPTIRLFPRPTSASWDMCGKQGPIVVHPSPVSDEMNIPQFAEVPQPVLVQNDKRRMEVRASLVFFLNQLMRKSEFREKQEEIILYALALKPVVSLLPTGAGKSLCYQLPSMLQPGLTIVIDPLKSLMKDQEENIKGFGIHRVKALMSGMEEAGRTSSQIIAREFTNAGEGQHYFLLISPERLQVTSFKEQAKLLRQVPIPYFVVDEAHCISEWGHDFRLSYLNLKKRFDRIAEFNICKNPGILALTGTASTNVLKDIVNELGIEYTQVVRPNSFDRKELHFKVIKTPAKNRLDTVANALNDIIHQYGAKDRPNSTSGLVFTNFAKDPGSARCGVVSIKNAIWKNLQINVSTYAGRNPTGIDDAEWERKKIFTQEQFKLDKEPILVCTHSFGMGIDKPNIRFTINAILPRSIEDFYQQAGRAGRDRQNADCVLVFSDDEPEISDRIMDTEATPVEELKVLNERIKKKPDAVVNTYFFWSNFKGRKVEKEHIVAVANHLFSFIGKTSGQLNEFQIRYSTNWEEPDNSFHRGNLEKALYRFTLVGLIEDYSDDYGQNMFTVRMDVPKIAEMYNLTRSYLGKYVTAEEVNEYLPSTQKPAIVEAAIETASSIVDFFYDRIVMRRRRSLAEMLRLARVGTTSQKRFRIEMLNYLQESKFTELVVSISITDDPSLWTDALKMLEDEKDIGELLGACIRQLEENPTNAGLLLLAGFCRVIWSSSEDLNDLRGGFSVLVRKHVELQIKFDLVDSMLDRARILAPHRQDLLLRGIMEGDQSAEMIDKCYELSDHDGFARLIALNHIMSRLIVEIQSEG